MQQSKDYKVTFAEARDQYDTDYGRMQSYALKLEGVDGYVQLGQKQDTPAPQEGSTLHGYTYEQNSRKGTFLKFKKVNPNYDNGGGVSKAQPQGSSSEDTSYMITLLEAIAKEVGADSAVKATSSRDTILDDIDEGQEIDLSEIPF